MNERNQVPFLPKKDKMIQNEELKYCLLILPWAKWSVSLRLDWHWLWKHKQYQVLLYQTLMNWIGLLRENVPWKAQIWGIVGNVLSWLHLIWSCNHNHNSLIWCKLIPTFCQMRQFESTKRYLCLKNVSAERPFTVLNSVN